MYNMQSNWINQNKKGTGKCHCHWNWILNQLWYETIIRKAYCLIAYCSGCRLTSAAFPSESLPNELRLFPKGCRITMNLRPTGRAIKFQIKPIMISNHHPTHFQNKTFFRPFWPKNGLMVPKNGCFRIMLIRFYAFQFV